jgi:hypothetical protein
VPRYRSRDGTHLTVCAVETGGRQQTATVRRGFVTRPWSDSSRTGRFQTCPYCGIVLRFLADAIILRHFLNRRATIISSPWNERTRTFMFLPGGASYALTYDNVSSLFQIVVTLPLPPPVEGGGFQIPLPLRERVGRGGVGNRDLSSKVSAYEG